ncbi:MAG TPA: lysophospholipid transporter LplT [Burkholderiaceae bacterium]|nr:lysophospholipid transporter LplT [Burkholderiaceae bacterium]
MVSASTKATVPRGFKRLLGAQFLSSLGDHAALIVAIAMLEARSAPAWTTPLLKFVFIASYVVFAFVVGAIADRWPKARVMTVTNALKAAGCALMLADVHPLLAYALIGFGAAAYSPAKVGLMLELLPAERLVFANAWLEGVTIASVILGTVLGGALVSAEFARWVAASAALTSPALHAAVIAVIATYGAAAVVNIVLPGPRVVSTASPSLVAPADLVREFARAFMVLLRDPPARVALAVTTLLWGVSAVFQFVVIDYGRLALDLALDRASMLQGVVAIGVTMGAVLASRAIALDRALTVLPLGLAFGPLVIALLPVQSLVLAALMMTTVGLTAGFFIVPMNALLQQRGHQFANAGQSIAVQNFCENLSVMVMLAVYALLRASVTFETVVIVFGVWTLGAMAAILGFDHRSRGRQATVPFFH